MRIERHNLDGRGFRKTRVYDMPVVESDYWASVTDVPCPVCQNGILRWAEAGYVPGYRKCDNRKCRRHFLARGNSEKPILLRVGQRKG